MAVYFGSTQITSVKKAAVDFSSLLVPSLANPGQFVDTIPAPSPSLTTGSLYTWGDNSGGQLGTGGTADVSYLTPQSDTNSWLKAVTGTDQYSHSLAIRADGSLYAAGYGFYGALGLGTNADSTTFALSASGTWSDVGVGHYHSLAIKSDGSLWTTGYNANGQLGIGSTSDTNSFGQVGSATDWASVEGGYHQSFAITTAGNLWAWGYGAYGSLGLGSTSNQLAPAQVGSATWSLISAFQFHTLGIQSDGTLWAWGTNGGRFGDGGSNNSNTPVQIGTDTWLSVAAGQSHSLGVKSDGTLWGWGYSTNYAHGGYGSLASPTQIGSATNWTKVSAGDDWSAAIDDAKGLYLWGSSTNSKTGGASSPTQVGSLLWESVYCGRQSGIGIAKTVPALLAPFDSDLNDVLGITGTATNTPTITSGGKFGSYAELGAADKLTYSSVSFGGGDYTVEFWAKRTESSWAPNGGNPLLELPGVALLGRAGTDTLQLYEDDFGSWAAVPGTTTSSIDQDWHHIALVRDGSSLRFYLDGSQVGSMTTSSNPSSLVFGAATIYGCRFGLDDLRVSTSAVYPGGTTFTPPTAAHPTSG